MTRSVRIHAALLVALLVFGYLVWTREPTVSEEQVRVVSLKGQLDRVVYVADDERKVTLEKRKDGRGEHVWLTVETWETPPPPARPLDEADKDQATKDEAKKKDRDPAEEGKDKERKDKEGKDKEGKDKNKPQSDKKADDKAADQGKTADQGKDSAAKEPKTAKEPKKIKKIQMFLGNEAASGLLERLATLSAARALGTQPADKLEAFGLKAPKTTLELVAGSTTRTFAVGESTYGSMDRYVLDRSDSRVYVVQPTVLGDFPYAEFRLMERDLTGFKATDVESVTVQKGDKQRTLAHKNPTSPGAAFWADASSSDKKDEMASNWMERVGQLSVTEYVPAGDRPQDLRPALTLTYRGPGGKPLGTLTLYEPPDAPAAGLPSDKGALPPPQKPADYYAETPHTRGLVKVPSHVAQQVLQDAAGVLK